MKYKNSLVLGKFYPPTLGHLHLINSAIEKSEKTHVFVCHRKDYDIDGKIRFETIRHIYSNNPNVIIHYIKHDFDDYPGEYGSTLDEFYDYWVNKIVYKHVKKLDVIFTATDYGDEFAHYLGIKHELIDIERKTYPVSGTKVRNNPYDYWDLIPNETKSYFIKKIVLVGPESSGKSTLSKLLSEKLNVPLVKEYGAEYFNEKNLNKNSKDNEEFTLLDINKIASGQIHLEDESLNKGEKMIICDTDLMTTQIWSEIYFGKSPKWIVDESYRRKYDLYLLMDIDFDWVDEGVREFPEKRQWHFDRIKKELDNRKLNYKIISGTIKERLDICLNLISLIN